MKKQYVRVQDGNGQDLPEEDILEDAKSLSSGDCVWFLTNVECFHEQYSDQSKPRDLFRAWGYDLNSKKFGLFTFGLDIARAMVQAGVPPLPWTAPLPRALALHRQSAKRAAGGGRFGVTVALLSLDEEVRALGSSQSRERRKAELEADATEDTWQEWQPKSLISETAVESAALSLPEWFAAGDLRRSVGDRKAPVSKVLKRLVAVGKLEPRGKGRATQYRVIPSVAVDDRKDWTD